MRCAVCMKNVKEPSKMQYCPSCGERLCIACWEKHRHLGSEIVNITSKK